MATTTLCEKIEVKKPTATCAGSRNKKPPVTSEPMVSVSRRSARIGVMRALNAGKPDPALAPRRKGAKAYKIVK